MIVAMTEGENDGRRSQPGIAAHAIGASLPTAVAADIGGPWAAPIGTLATPFVAEFAQRALDEIGAAREYSVEGLVRQAAEDLDIAPDDFLDTATADPQRTALLADAVFAAAQTLNQRKIAALEEPHIKVLLSVAGPTRRTDSRSHYERGYFGFVLGALCRRRRQRNPDARTERVAGSSKRFRISPR